MSDENEEKIDLPKPPQKDDNADQTEDSFESRMQEKADKTEAEAERGDHLGVLAKRKKQREPTEEEKNPVFQKNRKIWVAVIVVIVLALAALITWAIIDENNESEEVDTTSNNEVIEEEAEPEIITAPAAPSSIDENTDFEEVCAEFTELDLECSVTEETHNEYDRGDLVSQSIRAGEEAVAGEDEVVITYSRGPEESEFPALNDESLEYAEGVLYEIGVDIIDTDTISNSGLAEGQVVRAVEPGEDGETVSAESTVENGTEVVLLLSDGMVNVPDWSGESRESVTAEADELNINVEFVTEESPEDIDTVLGQSESGSIDQNEVVEVTVATPFDVAETEIPDVIGESPGVAQSELAEVGFTNIYSVEIPDDSVNEEVVTHISPGVGSTTTNDNNITIIIAVPE